MPIVTLPTVNFTHNVFEPLNLNTNLGTVGKVIANPKSLASRLQNSADDSKNAKINLSQKDNDELVSVYNNVIKDGRFITDFATDPKKVASKLGLTLSDSASAAVITAAGFKGVKGQIGNSADWVEVVCVAVVVVLCARNKPGEEVIIDRSGAMKL